MLDPNYSRQRQKRMLDVMQERKLEAIVLGLPQHIYYASAHRPFWLHSSAFVLLADGRSIVTTANSPNESAAADEVLSFEANWMGTQRQDQPGVVAEQVYVLLKDRKLKRIGIDASAVTSQVALLFDGHIESIDGQMWQVRRSKLPDELQLIRQAVRCTEAMYTRARQMIEPGLSEIDLYTELHAAAVKESRRTDDCTVG